MMSLKARQRSMIKENADDEGLTPKKKILELKAKAQDTEALKNKFEK